MSICLIGIGAFDVTAAYQICIYAGLSGLCLLNLAAICREHATVNAVDSRRRR
jgi:hypothetical protein